MPTHASADPLSRLRERARVRARTLRRDSTDAERALWQRLRDRRLAGHKFRRQHPIGPFFADFACVEESLVVEIDGAQHLSAAGQHRDAARTAFMSEAGWRVMRLDDRQVLTQLAAVLQHILDSLQASHPHPHPLPPAGEGVMEQEPT